MLADPAVQLIDIAPPTQVHAKLAIAALKAASTSL